MSAGKMTGWFQPEVKPVRGGVYEVKIRGDSRRTYCYWGGHRWGFFTSTPEAAELLCNAFADGASQEKIWRGFTEEKK